MALPLIPTWAIQQNSGLAAIGFGLFGAEIVVCPLFSIFRAIGRPLLFIVRPHPEHANNAFFDKDFVDQTVLDIDSP